MNSDGTPTTDEDRLVKALQDVSGNLLNIKIDLETGKTKAHVSRQIDLVREHINAAVLPDLCARPRDPTCGD